MEILNNYKKDTCKIKAINYIYIQIKTILFAIWIFECSIKLSYYTKKSGN